MEFNSHMEQYANNVQEELKQLIRDLCAIPAPSHQEGQRAAFCKTWFEQAGGLGVYIDEALNVVCPWGVTEEKPVVVVMAHMDTVFPDTEPMLFIEDKNRFYCPGVCDDTAQLAQLMILARYFIKYCTIPKSVGIVFVANSCEEGLGNLKGCRQIVKAYGNRMKALITIDGTDIYSICNRAVGSHRYRVTVKTEGGHSFAAFGNRNAIRHLASMIDTLYSVNVPQDGESKTTYNVGTISGGTSINTIAQEAQMLYEYRSDSCVCLRKMEKMFMALLDAYSAMGIDVRVEKIGDRPCAGEIDLSKVRTLVNMATEALKRQVNVPPCTAFGIRRLQHSSVYWYPSYRYWRMQGSWRPYTGGVFGVEQP